MKIKGISKPKLEQMLGWPTDHDQANPGAVCV